MKVVIYTYQSKEAVERLKKEGVLRLYEKDRNLTHLHQYDDSEYNYFEYPYKYMIYEMKRRLPPPTDEKVFYPMWAWRKVNGRYKVGSKMDEIHRGYMKLKLEIDESRLLYSDFDAFAAIISGYRVLEQDNDTIDYDSDNKFDKSLEKIFVLHRKQDDYFAFSFRSETIQATFWELFLDDVVEIIENPYQ